MLAVRLSGRRQVGWSWGDTCSPPVWTSAGRVVVGRRLQSACLDVGKRGGRGETPAVAAGVGGSSPSFCEGLSLLFQVRGEGAGVGSLERVSQPPPHQLEGWRIAVSSPLQRDPGRSPGL